MTRRLVVRLALSAVAVAVFGSAAAQQAERFFIVGYVKNPGSYNLKANMTVGEAIAAAGGVAAGRSISGIEIRRRDAAGDLQSIDVTLADAVMADDTISLK